MSYFEPPPGVATTREAYVLARRNEALAELHRQLQAIVARWTRGPVSADAAVDDAAIDSARALELFALVLELAERRLCSIDRLEAGRPAAAS